MDFDLSEVPEPVRQFIKDALQARRNALIGCEREIKQALMESVKRIQKELKGGLLYSVDENVKLLIESEKVNFAAKLDAITEKALTDASIAGLSIGERIKRAYNASAAGVKFKLIEKDIVREAELIAKSTMHKKRVFKNKPFVLSDKIWGISGNNLEKIKDIIESGVNTDARKVAEALACYVKKGAENFVKDYPALAERMGGRLPKDLVYEALRLARNELSETYWLATIEGYKDNPAIKAVKWLLSNNRIAGYHDICDELAYADDYGLGCGIYPLDNAPMKPHICCLCCLAPVILKDIEKGIGNTPPENWDEVKERLKNGHGFINMDELTEEQKEKLREQRRQAYQRRKEKKEAARKELDKKLEALYDKPKEYQKLYAETYGAKINDSKQNRHIAGNKTMKENASYFENDIATLQKIIDEKAGSGDLLLVNGRLTEIIQDKRLNGFDKSIIDGATYKTNKAKLHYSKTGVHLVPFYEWSEKK